MKIEKIMTRGVSTCSPSDSLNEAARLMWEGDYGALPVVDEQRRVLGIVTDRDICMGTYTQGVPLSEASVASVMSKQLFTCSPDDDIGDVEQLMRVRQIRRIPVVGDSGELLGIVTLGGLARCSQSSAFQKAMGGLPIAKTLASVCEPRAKGPVALAAE